MTIPFGPIEKIIRKISRHPFIVVSAATLGIRMGQDAQKVKKGEMDGAEFRARQGQNVGAVTGGLIGARLGMVAGSFLPGLGTMLGAFAGGFVGETVGAKVGRKAVEKTEKSLKVHKHSSVSEEDLEDLDRPPKRSI